MSAAYDAETLAVYDCEALFLEMLVMEVVAEPLFNDRLTPAQAHAEALEVLHRAGYADPVVNIVLSIGDDEDRAGSYDPTTNTIYGRHDGITRDVLLHELAHWCRPHVGHGPQFRAVHAELVGIVFGIDTANELLAAYDELGIDWSWYTPSTTTSDELLVGAA